MNKSNRISFVCFTCKQRRNKKYALANRRNCSNRFFGKNVIRLYFDVEISLPYSIQFQSIQYSKEYLPHIVFQHWTRDYWLWFFDLFLIGRKFSSIEMKTVHLPSTFFFRRNGILFIIQQVSSLANTIRRFTHCTFSCQITNHYSYQRTI